MIAPEEPEAEERILFEYPDRITSRVDLEDSSPPLSIANLMRAKISTKDIGGAVRAPNTQTGLRLRT